MRLTISDEVLVQLWFSADTATDIANEFGVSRREIVYAWKQLRERGLIPRLDRTAVRQEGSGQHHVDGRPRVDMLSYHDELLEALIREHGEPRYDIFPGKQQNQ